jgi:hypothetical protein
MYFPRLNAQRLPLHRTTHFHAERAGLVLIQRQAGSLEINLGLLLWKSLDALKRKGPVEEQYQFAEDQADDDHGVSSELG